MDKDKIFTVPELAKELNITDRAWFIVTLRGKRLVFSLSDIRADLCLCNASPKHKKQAKTILKDLIEELHSFKKKLYLYTS